ncbi:MAG: phosphatase PAP2 family protein [Lachnospiraceae bacterium]|jgi:undecaprenyl-diphosphatase|nr:phosphatase PAP2 family protein [Lachnospiraceae bacterium]
MQFLWFLSGVRTSIGESLALIATEFGQETILVVLLCAVYWFGNKQVALKAAFSYCIAGLSVQNFKLLFRISRPWILDTRFKPVEKALPAATGYSFPSGHTQSATSIYGSFFVSQKKQHNRLCYITGMIPVLVGFSRMYLGVHTPKDVIAAFIIGVVFIGLVHYFFPYMERGNTWQQYVLPTLCLLSAIGSVFHGYILYTRGIVEYANVVDCAKGGGVALGFLAGYYIEKRFVHYVVSQNRRLNMICLVIGLMILLGLKSGLKVLLGVSLLGAVLQNALLIIFIIAGYPWLLLKINNKDRNENNYEK